MESEAPGAGPVALPPDLDERLARIGLLQEPLRRALYLYVIAQGREVGRDEAAEALQVGRTVAAFHLDKLAEAGLLEVTYRRLTGRTGPGAGRPAKLYRRSTASHHLNLPPRDYELAAHLLATAIEEAGQGAANETVARVAGRFGSSLGEEARASLGRRPGRGRQLTAIEDVLARFGYEPYRDGSEVRLRNCPFHSLARAHVELACGMNLALLQGLVTGVGAGGVEARLDRRPDQCCVVLGRSGARGS